jgi:RNA binding exosome subunit
VKLPISDVDIRIFAHATEDSAKVMQAVQCLIAPKYFDDIKFQKTELKGHYGNPITLFYTKIKDTMIIEYVIKKLTTLNSSDQDKIIRESKLFIEKSSLYLRFDKQTAFLGKLQLENVDPIYVRIRFKVTGKRSKPSDIVAISKKIGLLP